MESRRTLMPRKKCRAPMKVHEPSCVVLVINDNLYGLMVALSYPCRACPLAMLEHHALVSRLKEEDKVMTKVIFNV